MRAHIVPIVRNLAYGTDVDAGVTLGMGQRLYDRAERRLRCIARQRIHRAIDRVDTRIRRREDRSAGHAACVMGVEMNGQPHLFFEGADQHARSGGFEQAGHVLEAQHMRACRLQFAGHADIVFEVVFRAVGVEDVARITDRAFADFAGLQNRIHRHAHVFHPVE